MFVKYWESIDEMPLYNWDQCTNGEFQYCRKKVGRFKGKTRRDKRKWDDVYNGYIKVFDLSNKYKKILRTMQRKALLQLKYVKSRQKFKLTEIKIQQQKLELMLKNHGVAMTIDESLIYLSKWMGGGIIDKKKITVLEYFHLLKTYAKQMKKAEKNGQRDKKKGNIRRGRI